MRSVSQGVHSVRIGECGHIGRILSGIHHSNIFFDLSPREIETKTKINKWDLIKLQSFCTAKEMKQKEKTSWIGRKYLQMMYWIRS